MQPEERDAAYLWDILDSAETILKFTSIDTVYYK